MSPPTPDLDPSLFSSAPSPPVSSTSGPVPSDSLSLSASATKTTSNPPIFLGSAPRGGDSDLEPPAAASSVPTLVAVASPPEPAPAPAAEIAGPAAAFPPPSDPPGRSTSPAGRSSFAAGAVSGAAAAAAASSSPSASLSHTPAPVSKFAGVVSSGRPPRQTHSLASAPKIDSAAHHDHDMKEPCIPPSHQPPVSSGPNTSEPHGPLPSQPAQGSKSPAQQQHQPRANPPPPLALSQGKRPSDESTGAGEIDDILSPHKKARTNFRPPPVPGHQAKQKQPSQYAPPPAAGATNRTAPKSQLRQDLGRAHSILPLQSSVAEPSQQHRQSRHKGHAPSIPTSIPEDGTSGSPRKDGLIASQTRPAIGKGVKLMSALNAVPGFPAPTDAVATAAASGTMLTKVEDVTTNRLPKGTVTTASPGRSSSTPGSWSSLDASMSSRSPDSRNLPPPLQSFQAIGIIELLEQDKRPTMVVDLVAPVASPPESPVLQVLYANPALRAAEGLEPAMTGAHSEDPEAAAQLQRFTAWVLTSPAGSRDSVNLAGLSVFEFADFSWSASTLRERFRIIYGNAIEKIPDKSPSEQSHMTAIWDGPNSAESLVPDKAVPAQDLPPAVVTLPEEPSDSPLAENLSDPGYFVDGGIAIPPPLEEDQVINQADPFSLELFENKMIPVEKPSFDWTRIPVTPDTPKHFRFARSIDWASTALGPIEEWCDDLRAMSNMVMASPHPVAMYWGPEYVTIYNEAYITLAGQKHPTLMGSRYEDGWGEIWSEIEPVFAEACRSGLATMKHEDRLFIYRHGFLEETWFSWSIIPLVGADGSIVGLLNPAFEDTRRKITERRMHTLREVGVQISTARDTKGFWHLFCKGLAFNDVDVPFALVYSINEDNGSEVSSVKSGSIHHAPRISLEGSIGAPEGHPAAPKYIDLANSDAGFAAYMRQSLSLGVPVVLRQKDGTFPTALVEGIDWKGFGEASHTIVVFPVRPTTGCDNTAGFVVLATNPRRPFNEDFELFVHLLSRQLDTATASLILFEEEIKRGQRAARLAALDRQELQKLLHVRTQEAEESEYRFTRMAEFAPVGMFIASSDGEMSYCNDTWWELSRHPRSEENIHTWMQSVHEDDLAGVEEVWQKLVKQKVTINHEFRFRYTRDENGHTMDAWVLLSAFPERCDTGYGIKSIFGCITDISQQKWAENVQIQRREEALELKRQQENFIDITSHEMRNPLSAILQCADEITNALGQLRDSNDSTNSLDQIVEGCLDAAATVSLCAGHQKRIVDDILTLSKLDSQLLLVTPVDVQPIEIVQQVLKMFETELSSNDISSQFIVEDSIRELAIDWVRLDPSRLMQVLINLMTNAVKFTQSCDVRNITVKLGASLDLTVPNRLPGSAPHAGIALGHPPIGNMTFFPRRKEERDDLVHDPEWGTGEPLNLHFSVEDTGEGVAGSEMKLLFQRFSQATPRTHVRYGGSGLGLFISRILTELQGGQIGVTSEKGHGSTFAFYIKSRKSSPPQDKKAAKKTKEAIKTVTAAHPEDAKALLASSNTPATTAAPLASATSTVLAEAPILPPPTPIKPSAPRSMSTPSRDTETGDLHRPSCVSPPILTPQSTLEAAGFRRAVEKERPKPETNGEKLLSRDILVVEDNLVNQKVLQKQLIRAGHVARVANHGGEALQILMRSKFWTGTPLPTPALPSTPSSRSGKETNPFDNIPTRPALLAKASSPGPSTSRLSDDTPPPNIDVILMDLEMPVMDGITCTRRIRELEAIGKLSRHIPIIAVTAYARPEQKEDAFEAGIDDVISKPFRVGELMPKVEENITRWEDSALSDAS